MKKWNNRNKKGKHDTSFKPSRQEIENAVATFIKDGGSIKKIVVNEHTYNEFIALNELPSAADDFLNGC